LDTETPFDTLKKGDKIVLDNIHFDNDESRLLAQSYKTLFEVLTYLQNNKSIKVEISGHTSSAGGLTHNMVLSSRRAQAVMKFLTNNGIESKRIVTEGFGPKFPIAENETETGQRENRRVEFRILSL
jgi:outer membrane protein OmpA-like peptidoglycan-associated protein